MLPGPHDGPGAGVAFTWENDVFARSDNNFTNGGSLSFTSGELSDLPPDSATAQWLDAVSFLPGADGVGTRRFLSWTLGQEVYTPSEIDVANPPPGAQPYAGILFLENSLHVRSERLGQVFALRVGVVGPSSLAERMQTEIHEATGATVPQGWDTQLPDEPIFNVGYSVGYLLAEQRLPWDATVRFVPLATVGAGTYFTGFSATAYAEIGWNLPRTIAGSVLRTGLDGTDLIGAEPEDEWSFSGYVGLGGYRVVHFLPLDGTVFRDSRSVDSEPFVGAASLGLNFRRGRFVLGVGRTFFTDAFEGQPERDAFGSVTLGWYW